MHMRIACPHCGERDRQEFTVLGDAAPVRPDGLDASRDAMFAYVYERDNVAGPHREFWYHTAGCHAWLVVTRDTRTHAVLGVECARDAALARRTGAR
jgi:heterotetrameric sarcosine oxidase delta subunit